MRQLFKIAENTEKDIDMKKTTLSVLCMILILFGQNPNVRATITALTHEASLITKAGVTEPVSIGTVVHIGDTIETKVNASVRLTFASGTTVDINENSRLALSAISPKEKKVSARWGKFDFDVTKADSKSRFKVETPVAIAGTEGTTFRVEVEKKSGQTTLSLTSGLLRVSRISNPQKSFLLKPNQGVMLSGGKFNFKPFILQKSDTNPVKEDSSTPHQLKKGKAKTTSHITGKSTKSQSVDTDKNSSKDPSKAEVIIEIE